MSNQRNENAESKLVIPIKYPIAIGCGIFPLILTLLCLLPIVTNTINVFENQRKWNSNNIADYSITIGLLGPGSQSQTVIVQDGKFSKSTSNVFHDPHDGIPALNLTVDALFSRAYSCFIYQFCHVEFDEVYGYPNYIGGGFIESGGFYADNLEPIKTEG